MNRQPSPEFSFNSNVTSSLSRKHTPVPVKVKLKSSSFGWPQALHYHGSVIPSVFFPVLMFTAWSVLIFCIANFVIGDVRRLSIPSTFISIISLVLSLLLVFRTNSAYERWNDGRKLWGTLIVHARNFIRVVWISVEETSITETRQKLAALQLVLAVFVSTRNHLRAEYGLKDELGNWRSELVSLIPRMKVLPTHPTSTDILIGGDPGASRPTSPNANIRNRMHASTDESLQETYIDVDEHKHPSHNDRTNIPIDISHLLTSYVITQRKNNKLDIPQFGILTQLVSGMVDTITNLERILTSPIPMAYTVHLKQALYIYLLMLPFQIMTVFFGWTVLIVFLASFTLLGVESIGQEIENPFGYDLNDLPCDQFVDDIRAEIEALLSSNQIDLAFFDLNVPAGRVGSLPTCFNSSILDAHRRLS